ncbi:MAG: hypothetical protein JO108_27425 [Acidobacteriaceae bacterium]|nr:hypothetical protein [Acidobacteriaceae bacterium]
MNIPATDSSVFALLLLSFVCLGCWANTLKLAGPRWRFEYFYLDFSVGALALAAIASFTLGSSGTDLGISDRVLVAGRMAQAWAVLGGVVFNIGNVLLIAAVSLLGMSAAFPLSTGVALIVAAVTSFRPGNVLLLSLGIACCLAAVILDARTCIKRSGNPTPAKRIPGKPAPLDQRRMRVVKGLITGVFGGVFLGFFYQLAANGIDGEFGLGPYVGVLLFALGILGSTLVFTLGFRMAAIEGTPVRLSSYFRGSLKAHLLGWVGGAIWAAGWLAALLAKMAPSEANHPEWPRLAVPIFSALLYVLWGLIFWKEPGTVRAKSIRSSVLAAAVLAIAIVLVSNGLVG